MTTCAYPGGLCNRRRDQQSRYCSMHRRRLHTWGELGPPEPYTRGQRNERRSRAQATTKNDYRGNGQINCAVCGEPARDHMITAPCVLSGRLVR